VQSNAYSTAPILQGATNGTIGPQGVVSTPVTSAVQTQAADEPDFAHMSESSVIRVACGVGMITPLQTVAQSTSSVSAMTNQQNAFANMLATDGLIAGEMLIAMSIFPTRLRAVARKVLKTMFLFLFVLMVEAITWIFVREFALVASILIVSFVLNWRGAFNVPNAAKKTVDAQVANAGIEDGNVAAPYTSTDAATSETAACETVAQEYAEGPAARELSVMLQILERQLAERRARGDVALPEIEEKEVCQVR
jgi:hypothetical protein